MSVVPKKIAERIQWYRDHAPLFTANAAAIGITPAEATDLAARAAAAKTAFDAQQAAQLAAESATTDLRAADQYLSQVGAALIAKVRAKAALGGGTAVYALAGLPTPATPSPVGNPGTPSNFAVQLFQDGSLELTWRAKNPKGSVGTMYQVYRRTTPAGEFAYVGGTGSKKFVDTALPAGVSQVTYQVQGVRSTAVGAWGQFNVNFGSAASGGGGMTASVGEATAASPKLAA
jgi:hypothetical protein